MHTVITLSIHSDKTLHEIKNALEQIDVLLDATPYISKIKIDIILFLFNITKKLLKWRYTESQELLDYIHKLELKVKHGKLIELIEKVKSNEDTPLDVCILIETITDLITKYNLRLTYYNIDYSTHNIGMHESIYIHIVLYFDINVNKNKLKQFKNKLIDKTNIDNEIKLYKDIDDEHYVCELIKWL